MSREDEFRKWLIDKITEILEEVHQQSDESCPFCCQEDYAVEEVEGEWERCEPGEADEYHIDHDEDCLVVVLENWREKIEEQGLWC